jgi:hypothetical protein
LRDACDEYAMAKANELRDRLLGPNGMTDPTVLAAMHPAALRLQSYLMRSMMDGKATSLFDASMESGRVWLVQAGIETVDAEAYIATLVAMKIGMFLMRDQVGRVLGEDMSTVAGNRRMLRASIELFSVPMLTPELAEQTLKALDSLYPTEE